MSNVYTIPAHQNFIPTLIEGLQDRLGDDLARALILLPSRRACIAVRDAFLAGAEGRAMLLPRLQPVGEAAIEDVALDPAAAWTLATPIAPIARLTTLTRLVAAQGLTFEQAVRLAAELAKLLDELATEDVPIERLRDVVPAHLAAHWQESLRFLDIIGVAWPALLAARQMVDPASYRNQLLSAITERLRDHPPRHPVVAAGMNGSIPAVARLLKVIAATERGSAVLPGLDLEIDSSDWLALGPGHPQFALRKLLGIMEVPREDVTPWLAPDKAPPEARIERLNLLRQALRPAESSEAWAGSRLNGPKALEGMTLSVSGDLNGEAMELAIRIREALEIPDRKVALVTSNRHLARRVAAELSRWGIIADDSAGVPLDQSPPGTFMLLAAHMVAESAAPIRLLSLLKHPLAVAGQPKGELRRIVRAMERSILRGQRPASGLEGLIDFAKAHEPSEASSDTLQAIITVLESLATHAKPLQALMKSEQAAFVDLLKAHLALSEWLCADETGDPTELWSHEAGRTLNLFVAELFEAAPDLGIIATSAYPAILAVLMGQETVRSQRPGHPRVAILGQLESRLNSADLVLIGGLNEGVWPRSADSGPWLNRDMRQQLGLPPAEQAIGIAAHDFVMNAMAPEIVLSRANKDQAGAPTQPSRWLSRLTAVLRANGRLEEITSDKKYAYWTSSIDAPKGIAWPAPIRRPSPRPPVKARPRVYWATHLQELVRDPYQHYARRILNLRELDPIDAEPGPLERGQVIHAAIDRFLREYPTGQLPDDAQERLLAIGRTTFATLAAEPRIAVLWWPRFKAIAEWFVTQERERRGVVARVLTEIEGEIVIPSANGELPGIRIKARADRIELGKSGAISIGDYKTGVLPSNTDIRTGRAPQLPVEAAIARSGGYPGIEGEDLAELTLWGLRGGEPAGEIVNPTMSSRKAIMTADELAGRARNWLERLTAYIEDPLTSYAPTPRPEIARRGDGYEHLARLGEWYGTDVPSDADGEDP
ncbi:ATP-dependent helicase/nuclease subunit B [Arboricoccus pini]|uniref:ATP-dependent helicase/nuclease subunit B n=1 Tax=Arboricoccus pini TaxID=1963835 RepID=A0A212QZS5_9PROT|nr:double-strand break repair protein AddB [Arboricoccus pini]SNB65248.1 ATP-dependent helicase/nuclease subunit B [Arboricoccus pini]